MKINKQYCMYTFGVLVLFLVFVMTIYFGYLLVFDGNKVIDYNGPMKVYSVNNESIDVLIDYCKYEIVPLTIYPAYINGIIYNLPPEQSGGSEPGCYVVHRLYDLPPELPNGVYHFQVRNEFKVNKLKTVVKSWQSEEFVVNR